MSRLGLLLYINIKLPPIKKKNLSRSVSRKIAYKKKLSNPIVIYLRTIRVISHK